MNKLFQRLSHPLKIGSWPRAVIKPLLTKNPNSFRIVDEGLPTSDEEVPPSLKSEETVVMLVPHCVETM